ncbi:MAG: tetratricopeptide repeat protein, partial [Methylococcaceae bacterium]|nr:tetratricopeptide repeat protein [Methylococcaceae bacterium]
MHQQGQLERADALYTELLKEQPQHIDALHFSGVLANQLGQAQRAVDLISLALKIDPNNAAAHSNLGLALQALQHYDKALVSYDRALAIQPNNADTLASRGNVLLALNRYDEVIINYAQALAIKPDLEFIFGAWLQTKMIVCDWHDVNRQLTLLANGLERREKISVPFNVLTLSSSPTLQKKAAEIYTQTNYPSNFLLPLPIKPTHSKIKIGYFSSDFNHHPVAHLMAELFERHDRSRFEIIAFSFNSANQKDVMRLRLEAAFDQFIDVRQQSDEQVVRMARQLEIDIAIDLNGYTKHCRTGIFAMRAAPIQVSYLGYLGTMGADYMDYLLADLTLIPEEHQVYYNEKIAYLPDSFQV